MRDLEFDWPNTLISEFVLTEKMADLWNAAVQLMRGKKYADAQKVLTDLMNLLLHEPASVKQTCFYHFVVGLLGEAEAGSGNMEEALRHFKQVQHYLEAGTFRPDGLYLYALLTYQYRKNHQWKNYFCVQWLMFRNIKAVILVRYEYHIKRLNAA